MSTDIPGIILAGGLSRRMGGGDKSLKMLSGSSIISLVAARLRPQVSQIALNANGDPTRFAELCLPVLPDTIAEFPGPLAGVLAGLDWAAGMGAGHIVTVAADTPFFPRDLVSRLMHAAAEQDSPIALAATSIQGMKRIMHPTFGLWKVDLRDDLRAALNDGLRKIVTWTDRHGAAVAEFAVTPHDPFFNINTPEDMVEAERILITGRQ